MTAADRQTRTHDLVREAEVPGAARALATLAAVDYEDGFLVAPHAGERRSGEEWGPLWKGRPRVCEEACAGGGPPSASNSIGAIAPRHRRVVPYLLGRAASTASDVGAA